MDQRRKWRSSNALCDLIDYRVKRNNLNFVMKQARTNYYQNLIEENGSDQRKLFKLSKELLNLNPKQLFNQHSDNYILANSIGLFLTEKITKIRSELDSRPLSCDDLPSTSASPTQQN